MKLKKFNQYIKEGSFLIDPRQRSIEDVMSIEDVEDQFLRLKEVFGCDVKINMELFIIFIIIDYDTEIINYKEMYKEFCQIKDRIGNMYPQVSVFYPNFITTHKLDPEKMKEMGIHFRKIDSLQITIRLKK